MPVINYKLYEQIDVTQERINNILKYIEENPNSDPNAYEMNDLLFSVARLGAEGRKYEETPYAFLEDPKMSKLRHDLFKMMDIRMEQLIQPDIGLCESKSDSLYQHFEKSIKNMATLNSLGDKDLSDNFSKACGINLYVKQRLRELEMDNKDEVIYDNKREIYDLLNNLENCNYQPNQEELMTGLLSDIKAALGNTPKEYRKIKLEEKNKESENPCI